MLGARKQLSIYSPYSFLVPLQKKTQYAYVDDFSPLSNAHFANRIYLVNVMDHKPSLRAKFDSQGVVANNLLRYFDAANKTCTCRSTKSFAQGQWNEPLGLQSQQIHMHLNSTFCLVLRWNTFNPYWSIRARLHKLQRYFHDGFTITMRIAAKMQMSPERATLWIFAGLWATQEFASVSLLFSMSQIKTFGTINFITNNHHHKFHATPCCMLYQGWTEKENTLGGLTQDQPISYWQY